MRCRHRASSSRSYVELCAAPWLSDLGLAAGIAWARVDLAARARPAHSTIVEPSSPPGTRQCTQNRASGVEVLIEVCQRARRTETLLRLVVNTRAVARMVKILQLDRLFPIYHELADALTG